MSHFLSIPIFNQIIRPKDKQLFIQRSFKFSNKTRKSHILNNIKE